MDKKKKIIISVAVISIIAIVTLVLFFVLGDNEGTILEREKKETLKSQTQIVYNDNISFNIINKEFKFKNKDVGKESTISFAKTAKFLAVARDCDPEKQYNVFLLTDAGNLYVNKYPSFRTNTNNKKDMDFDFLYVIANKKITDIEEVKTTKGSCTSSEVYAVTDSNEKLKIKLNHGNTSYSQKSKKIISAFLDDGTLNKWVEEDSH